MTGINNTSVHSIERSSKNPYRKYGTVENHLHTFLNRKKKMRNGIWLRTILTITTIFLSLWSLMAQADDSIYIGTKEKIFSKKLNEQRKIWIYTPNLTTKHPNSSKRYPVLYLLDGDAHFFSTVGIVQQLSQANGNGVLPEMIVVAIENTNRLRDLVPSSVPDNPNPFVQFLEEELIPHIENNYPTAPYRVLIGHSLGGLTVMEILTHHTKLFNGFISIDPSMWYNNEWYLKKSLEQLPKLYLNEKKLFVGIANTMPPGMQLSQAKTDTGTSTLHIRSILKLDESLQKMNNGLAYSQRYYENENHNSLPLMSTHDGLRFIFDFFHLKLSEKDFADSSTHLATQLERHYKNISDNMGYNNTAPEELINFLAYEALGKNHLSKADALFQLNRKWNPQKSSVYRNHASYFLTIGDTSAAIPCLEKAIQLNNDSSAMAILNALKQPNRLEKNSVNLHQYAGQYVLTQYNLNIALVIRDNKLWALVPGQEDSELVPVSRNVFTVRGKQGYTITFKMNKDRPQGFTSVQPNGTFEAVFKK